jgi:putative glutamine amidotransferase
VNKPIIGITLDSEEPGGYSLYPWYALRKNYFETIAKNGGVPIALPHFPELAQEYLNLIDGVIITGGAFDIGPEYYGEEILSDTVTTKPKRTLFELALINLALKTNKPILGICGGEQLLNVALGGSLIQHIPDTITNALEHEQPMPKDVPWHQINIISGSLLHQITGVLEMQVNSTHHQAVKALGKNITTSAVAPDGVIEAIEYREHPFCLGVQWHPEYGISEYDNKIIQSFIEAAKQ